MKLWKFLNIGHRLRGAKQEFMLFAEIGLLSSLSLVHIGVDGTRTDLGVVSRRVVTDAGVAFIAQAFTNTTEVENLNYHASGTGTNAENVTDTALQTEVATRATGTQSNPSAGVYRTVGTITYAGSFAITEHGILSAASAGTLLDRSVFSAVNVTSGEGIEFTYNLTFAAGG